MEQQSEDAGAAAAVLQLAEYLKRSEYHFICPTPESQGRIVKKRKNDARARAARNLEDLFGWSLPAHKGSLEHLFPPELLKRLVDASILINGDEEGTTRSQYRISNFYLPHIDDSSNYASDLFYVHSAFPTTQSDAVFFGPDTYLFLDFLTLAAGRLSTDLPGTIVDVCCGSGAGAIHMARLRPKNKVIGLDLNNKALVLGKVNAQLAKVSVDFAESDLLKAVWGTKDIDVIVSNPPYIASSDDGDVPVYAAGGAQQGLDLPLRIVHESMRYLREEGLLMIYTGVPIAHERPGHDPFLEQIRKLSNGQLLSYRILHPDMFGEELSTKPYMSTGRIQVVGAVIRKTTR